MELAHSGATHLLFGNYKPIARTQLYTRREQGGFRRSQEAYQQTMAGFHTDGIKSLGRFTLAGQFDFEKRWDDSAAWWNGGEFKETQPYYFFAGKASPLEKQLFNLSATLVYNLWKNKLYVGTSGNYRYHWTTRSVDPRPNVKEFNTRLRPEITARFGPHVVGSGFIWGRGSESTTIGFKNRNFNGNPTYIERNNFLSLGYGHIGKFDRYLGRYNETSGLFAHYASAINNWAFLASGEYELWQEDITLDTTSTRNNHNLFGFLQHEKTTGKLLINHSGNKSRQQWEINFATQSMLNWASEFNATSYQYTATEGSIVYRQLWQKNNGIAIELGAGCDYNEQFKEDIVAAHKYELKIVTPQLYAAIYRRSANKSWLALRIIPSIRHTLANDLSIPVTQENYFTKGIVYTDYLYWQKNSPGITTQFDFIEKEKPKRNRIGFTLKANWQQAATGGQSDLPALYIPSGSRWSASASLNLYL